MPQYERWNRLPNDKLGAAPLPMQGMLGRKTDQWQPTLKELYDIYQPYLMDMYRRENLQALQDRKMPLDELAMSGLRGLYNQEERKMLRDRNELGRQGYQFNPESEMSPLFYGRNLRKMM